MDLEATVERLWQATQRRVTPELAPNQSLTLDDAYQVQLAMLARHIASGEKQAGWKIGITSAAARSTIGLSAPVFGYLLAGRHFASGGSVPHAEIRDPAIESELCMTIGQALHGPHVTPKEARQAVAAVAPAFEIVERRLDIRANLPLGVADNVVQWGFVTAEKISPLPENLNPGAVIADLFRNGESVERVRGADSLDDVFEPLASLANHLSRLGRGLKPGDLVMTGTYTKPTAIACADAWQARFSDIGSVNYSFT